MPRAPPVMTATRPFRSIVFTSLTSKCIKLFGRHRMSYPKSGHRGDLDKSSFCCRWNRKVRREIVLLAGPHNHAVLAQGPRHSSRPKKESSMTYLDVSPMITSLRAMPEDFEIK